MILATCSDPGIAVFAKILKNVFDMILIIGPIVTMVSLGILFFRLVTFDYDEKTNYNATVKYRIIKKQIKNAVMALVIVIFLPVFVNLTMQATFMKDTFQIAACFDEAKSIVFSTKSSDYNNKNDEAKKKNDKQKTETGTFIIDPSKYRGVEGNPNATEGGDYSNLNGNVDLSTRQGQIQGAINWAINIANDDSFNYGQKPYASDCGCYFCKTNGNKARAARGHADGTPPAGKSWDKTYVCMTYVGAAYAHGAQDPTFLKYCKNGSTPIDGNADIQPTMRRLGNVLDYVGKPAYDDLQPGDILMWEGVHTSMYIGNGKYVEASSGYGAWDPQSIAVRDFSRSNYSQYTGVLRYKGR